MSTKSSVRDLITFGISSIKTLFASFFTLSATKSAPICLYLFSRPGVS